MVHSRSRVRESEDNEELPMLGVGYQAKTSSRAKECWGLIKPLTLGFICGLALIMVLEQFRNHGSQVSIQMNLTEVVENTPHIEDENQFDMNDDTSEEEDSLDDDTTSNDAIDSPPVAQSCLSKDVYPSGATIIHQEVVSSASTGTFFILEDKNGTTSRIIECYLSLLGVPVANSSDPFLFVDEKLFLGSNFGNMNRFRFALNDILLLQSLKSHPNRVFDESNASFVLIESMPFVSYSLPPPQVLSEICPNFHSDELVHKHRERATLNNFADHTLSTAAIIHSSPVGRKGTLKSIGAEFFQSIHNDATSSKTKIFFMTSGSKFIDKMKKDKSSPRDKKRNIWPNGNHASAVIIPVLGNQLLRSESPGRNVTFYFDDDMLDADDIKTMNLLESAGAYINPRNSVNRNDVINLDLKDAAFQRVSQFCLILDYITGDSNKGLVSFYDAIEHQCIPMYMGHSSTEVFSRPELPFARAINWDQVYMVMHSLDCVKLSGYTNILLSQLSSNTELQDIIRGNIKLVTDFLVMPNKFLDPRLPDPHEAVAAFGENAVLKLILSEIYEQLVT